MAEHLSTRRDERFLRLLMSYCAEASLEVRATEPQHVGVGLAVIIAAGQGTSVKHPTVKSSLDQVLRRSSRRAVFIDQDPARTSLIFMESAHCDVRDSSRRTGPPCGVTGRTNIPDSRSSRCDVAVITPPSPCTCYQPINLLHVARD